MGMPTRWDGLNLTLAHLGRGCGHEPLIPLCHEMLPLSSFQGAEFCGQGPAAGPTVLVLLSPRAEPKFWTLQGIVSMDCD